MKAGMKSVLVGVVLVGMIGLVSAWDQVNTSVQGFTATLVNFIVDSHGGWQINGTNVTADATELNKLDGFTGTTANLNSGLASSGATLVSNVNAKAVFSNLVVVAGGTVSAPASSIAAASVAGGTLAGMTLDSASTVNALTLSNMNALVKASNVVVSAGGSLTVGDGSTITFPAASIASAALPATMSSSTLLSNATLKVSAQKVNVLSGGEVVIAGMPTYSGIYSNYGAGVTTVVGVCYGSVTNVRYILPE